MDLPYDGEALPAILGQPKLISDTIHPNAKGYRMLAEAVAELLRESGEVAAPVNLPSLG